MKSNILPIILRPSGLVVVVLLSVGQPVNFTAAPPKSDSAGACPVSKTVMIEPEKADGADRFGYGAWYVNENRTIWARNTDWRAGENKTLWKKPVETHLLITGKRLDGPAAPLRAGYANVVQWGFAVLDLKFGAPGCWDLTATDGTDHLEFVTEVMPARTDR